MNLQNDTSILKTPFFKIMWIILFFVEFVKGALLILLLPVYMATTVGLSAQIIGVSFAVQYLGDNLFRGPAGWIGQRIGVRITIMSTLALTMLSLLLFIFFKGATFLVTACFLLGIATSPLWPCIMTEITALTGPRNQNGTAMSVLEIAALGGTGLGPISMNWLLEKINQNYRIVFFILLAIIVFLFFLSLFKFFFLKTLPATYSKHYAKANRLGMKLNIWKSFSYVRKTLKVNPIVYISLFLQSFSIGLLTPVVTLYIHTELHLPSHLYSMLLIAGGGITVLGLLPVGKLADRFGTLLFLKAGFLLAACSLLFFVQIKSVPLLFLVIGLIGLSFAFILPTGNAFVAKLVPSDERGLVWGFFLTLQGSGMILGPVLSGILWDKLGHKTPFIASAIVMAVLFIMYLSISMENSQKNEYPYIK